MIWDKMVGQGLQRNSENVSHYGIALKVTLPCPRMFFHLFFDILRKLATMLLFLCK